MEFYQLEAFKGMNKSFSRLHNRCFYHSRQLVLMLWHLKRVNAKLLTEVAEK